MHDLASDPDTLAKMLEKAKSENKQLTSPVAKKQIAQRKIAKKVKALKAGKDDADTALATALTRRRKRKSVANKLTELANDADTRVSPHLPELTQREDLIDAITLARDDATKAVTAWDQLLKKVSAAHHEKQCIELMVDFGAYSAFKLDGKVDLDDYIEFVKRNKEWIAHHISLDQIPGSRHNEREIERAADISYRQHRVMKRAGLSSIPVLHENERLELAPTLFGRR